MAERGEPVLRAGQLGDVGVRAIVDGADAALLDRYAHEHGGDGLAHRPRREAVGVAAAVLVALDEDGVALSDEEAGGGMPRQVAIERSRFSLEPVGDGGLPRRAAERARDCGPGHHARAKDLVQTRVGIDEIPERPPVGPVGAREAGGTGSVVSGIGPGGVEGGLGRPSGVRRGPAATREREGHRDRDHALPQHRRPQFPEGSAIGAASSRKRSAGPAVARAMRAG